MQTTTNLGLKKPEQDDLYNIQDINDNMDILDEKVQECFQSVSDGKSLVASAITDKGVATSATDTFATMASNVSAIKTDPKLQSKSAALSTIQQVITADTGYDGLSQVTVPAVEGTASDGDVIAGKTFNSASGINQTGTLADKTGVVEYTATASIDSTNSELEMTIPATGKYNTSNKLKSTFTTIASLIGLTAAKIVKGNTILGITGNSNNMDTSSGDATAAQILSGKKACVDGSLLTGTMTNNGAVAGTISTSGGTYTVPAGYHNGSGKVTGPTLASLIGTNVTLSSAANLLTGNTAYGKNGTKYTGSMANNGSTTLTASAVTQDDDYTYLTIPANGYYNTSSKVKTANSNLNNVQSGAFTATLGEWYTVDLGYKPTFVQIISTDNIASIQYFESYSKTNYCIGIFNSSMQIVSLGSQPSYGYYNFKITDTGFQYYRSYNSALSCKWVAGKY